MHWLGGEGIGRGEGPFTGPRQKAYIDSIGSTNLRQTETCGGFIFRLCVQRQRPVSLSVVLCRELSSDLECYVCRGSVLRVRRTHTRVQLLAGFEPFDSLAGRQLLHRARDTLESVD